MSDPREDREFDAYMAGGSPLSKAYAQQADELPPPELDARVLAAAEQELKVVPMPQRWRRWGGAVGIAATVLLAISLVMQPLMQQQDETVLLPDRLGEDQPLAGPGEADAGRRRPGSAALGKAEERHVAAPSVAGETRQDRMEQALPDRMPMTERAKKATQAVRPAAPEIELAAPARPGASGLSGFAADRPDKEIAGGIANAHPPAIADAGPVEKLQAAMALIEDYLAGQHRQPGSAVDEIIVTARRAEDLASPAPELSQERDADDEATAGSDLDAIVDQYDAGNLAQANEQLAAFRGRYPDHPVSRLLAEAGY